MTTIFSESHVETRVPTISGLSVWMFGILLPLTAILFEIFTGFCSQFIDPMPTLWHAAVLFSVPVCNWVAWWGLKSDMVARGRQFAAISGFSGAIAMFYAILFLPITPLALVGLLVVLPGLGLAPALALLTALRLMKNWAGFVGRKPVTMGFLAGVVTIVLLAWPAIGVRAGAGLVQSERSWVRNLGHHVLGLDGVRQELLSACHSRGGGGAVESIAFITGRGPLTRAEAQPLYYRVTGRAFEQEPPDALKWRQRAEPWFDLHRGGDRVGTPAEKVRLASSRLDGSVDARSAIGYFEWTLVFRNSSNLQQEARTEIALPKGAVVSRATLWIHGSEREAAFGERGQVRQAYESVVRMRRDPLLVTSNGPDRVLVQCFPIEPGGEMKIRLGITAPVVPVGDGDRGTVTLPVMLSQNFDAAEPAWVWIESKNAMSGATLREDGVYVVRRKQRENERTAVHLGGMSFGTTWAQESADKVVEQRFVERTVQPPKRVTVVVDASESMRAMRDEIEAALATIPKTVDASVVTVGQWRGGVDAVPALQEALPGPVLWIAGDQPVRFAGTDMVRQALERDRSHGQLFVLAAGGTNLILRDLEGLPRVETVPRLGAVGEDLRRFVAQWRAPYQEHVAERTIVAASDAERGSPHIARLWAAQESAKLAGRHRADAVALAVAHQIVTPLSGAVVLETAAQFAQNGLQPASPSTVPTMPEPETYGLIAVGLGVLGWLRWRK